MHIESYWILFSAYIEMINFFPTSSLKKTNCCSQDKSQTIRLLELEASWDIISYSQWDCLGIWSGEIFTVRDCLTYYKSTNKSGVPVWSQIHTLFKSSRNQKLSPHIYNVLRGATASLWHPRIPRGLSDTWRPVGTVLTPKLPNAFFRLALRLFWPYPALKSPLLPPTPHPY